jgi:hypothetical protein
VRIIHDFSWPPKESVNAHIRGELCSVKYVTVEDAARMIKKAGKGALMCKLDLADAYKNIRVRKEDWHYLGTTWKNKLGDVEYYIDTVLPFGLRFSATQFTILADGLEYCMYQNGVSSAIHYLDDFFSCGKAGTLECETNLRSMVHTCNELGMPVTHDKTEVPVSVMEFLGVVLDSEKMEMRMSETRLNDVKSELESWMVKKSGTK